MLASVTVPNMIEAGRNRLREIREQTGKERYDICAYLRVSDDTVRRWEDNRGGPIPSKYIPALAAFLEVDTAFLMGWDRAEAAA